MSYRGANNGFNGVPATNQQQQQQSGFDYSAAQSRAFNAVNNSNNNRAGNGGSQGSFMIKLQRGLDQLNTFAEDLTDKPFVKKLQPYIPGLARFFIVATFYEDSIRLFTQWSDQVFFLHKWKHYPRWFVVCFLVLVTVVMSIGSTLFMLRKQTNYATGALCACIILQGLVYGLFTGSSFILRNFSVIGGLLIAFSDSIVQNKTTFGMLPELQDKNQKFKGYLLLAGRILIVLMFVGFAFSKSWFTVFLTLSGTVCFAIGYKTKLASLLLGLILVVYNLSLNNYWLHTDSKRDFLRYEFYQNLSIIGGLLLVTNTGAGDYSVDSKKKIY
ncbi:similar to Saccharomyces cerevisiae YGR284C ERV29 Protein localized to COPII-coated vesicles, involved in vesicle formation and incorporation of specific secretory cargo [Maudiozyma barnettii]|uniref:Similar to Saccharomyces cerevisiae YGR284C ERV29 Protein localized to COPII-coated vesicles, involved in vesicle formation and incorporation of specific secretory cargo n=1 Tax=Maudiozyma barnettii TaxID=61262 RepID=A0A8H2VIQ1_9SACH|nr:Erv29p [Kazachstania barnettii]CAB4256156.1 similar to Saccharomyces cerevisiae YGR284C ERV29 Protein localized to COPII-coated vesicles, involved in vesicle formation and incorporation of specific secretory cargo [Kazachstania barnettii]CAD1784764.1 similar to Saccharomyces cerevisiae YGR284C ERV29 Protein localized to COPII-coated vesicles, involved in vesicle formation and incorporation of specific secretory cargo [Kazachstania barnettii]